jgi:hypothetical protein
VVLVEDLVAADLVVAVFPAAADRLAVGALQDIGENPDR